MSKSLPKVDVSTQPSTDKMADREPKADNSNVQVTPSESSENAPENAENAQENALIPVIDLNGEKVLNPAFIMHCSLNHPNAFGKKGWKETQLAITGHKGQLSEAEKELVGKVFKMLLKHAKAESSAFVDDADFVEIRSNKRVFDDRNHTAERTTMLRCTRGIEYSS